MITQTAVSSCQRSRPDMNSNAENFLITSVSIRPIDPEGLLEGDPLAVFNKKTYRITLIGGGIGRKEIVFL